MKCTEIWTEIIPKTDPNSNITNQVWSSCFNNDGSILLACVGDAILVYDAINGNLVNKAIRGGQKDQINCIKFSKDGKRFATASNDKTVWVWTFDLNKNPKLAPEVKYSHSEKVNCLAFNPLTNQIFSGGIQDYAVWSPEKTNIDKQKFKDKIISCGWSQDGLYLGFGTMGGTICIKDRELEQLAEIQRSFPIWCMDWTPITPDSQNSVLAVGVWEQSIAFYNSQGQQLGSDKKLTYDPLDINFSSQGEFMLVSGTNKKSTLYTRDGGLLIEVSTKNDWIWSNKLKPIIKEAGSVAVQDQLHVAMTTNDGEISMFKIQQLTVHALQGDKYAYRDNLTDIVVQSMSSNSKIRLKCKELVKNVSIYNDKLAAHLTERILIYGVSPEDGQIKYKLHKRIVKKVEAHILEVVTNHFLACVKNKIQLYQLSGELEKEWIFDSRVNCLKVIGGMPSKEGAYVGLKNGQIFKIFVDNSFPIPVLNHNISVKMIDVSQKRKRISVVDKNSNLTVYDLTNKEQVFQEMNIISCAFNNDFDDLLAFSSNDTTFIRSSNHPPLSQKMQGTVVGFKTNKLFVLNENVMSTIDISMTQTMIKYLERKEFQLAYEIALLGVTDQDFLYLGNEALIATQFAIARKCYTRIKKLDFIYLLEKAEKDFKKKTFSEGFYQGEIYGLQGKFYESENALVKANLPSQAKDMWILLKEFDKAMRIDTGTSPTHNQSGLVPSDASRKDLMIQRAEWEVKQGNWKKGGDLYIQAELYKKAIEVYIANNHSEGVLEVCRIADAESQRKEIEQCAAYFKKTKQHQYTKEAYLKLQDNKALLQLNIDQEKWEEAMTLAKAHPEFMEIIKLPYANWLAKQDRYEESLKAYRKIGKHELATKMLYNLSQNAVFEKRFSDAALFTWMIATEYLGLVRNMKTPTQEDIENLQNFYSYRDNAEIYFAYSKVQSFVDEPFLPLSGHSYMLNIFNAARFAINKLGNKQLYGVQHSYLYYSLGKVSKQLEAYKTARNCYEKLASYQIPTEWSEEIELSTLLIRSKPYSDQESLLPICNRCLNQNPALTDGNRCSSCMHSFQNCFISFENLPLVEFKLDPKINHKRFIELINTDKSKNQPNKKKKKPNDGWQEQQYGDQQVLTFNNSPQKGGNGNGNDENSPFLDKLSEVFEIQQTTQEYIPVTLDENILSTLNIDEVYWVDYTKYSFTTEIKYYKSMLTDIPLKNCSDCGTFYILDEYEFEISKTGKCPFCRSVDERAGPQKDVFDF